MTELFEEAKNDTTPIMVERVVNDIDEIVRYVRFDGWQNTHAEERQVKMALRKTLFRYKLHQDQELFDRAYGLYQDVLLTSGAGGINLVTACWLTKWSGWSPRNWGRRGSGSASWSRCHWRLNY